MFKLLLPLIFSVCNFVHATPLPISESDAARYWVPKNHAGTLSPALQRMSDATLAAIRKLGRIFVTMDYSIDLTGAVSKVVVLKIEPAEVDSKPFAAMMTLAKFQLAPNAKPTEIRVHVERRPNWIPAPE